MLITPQHTRTHPPLPTQKSLSLDVSGTEAESALVVGTFGEFRRHPPCLVPRLPKMSGLMAPG